MPIIVTHQIREAQRLQLPVKHLGFSGGERHVQLDLEALSALDRSTLKIRAELRSSDDVFDLLLTRNALAQAMGDFPIDIEIPYLPYARQDRVCAPGQAFSLQVMAQLLSLLGASDPIAVWDCHSLVGTKLTGATNVLASSIVAASDSLRTLIVSDSTVLVCPDKGARGRCEEMAATLGARSLIYCEKVRDPSTGSIIGTTVGVDDLSGKTAVITDDLCDGGMTFIKIAEQLKAKHADRVVLFVTHGIFAKGLDVFDGLIDHIYTSNSFPQAIDDRLTCIEFEYSFPSKQGN
jgi:ribose-phosphate pyrophosphokinase